MRKLTGWTLAALALLASAAGWGDVLTTDSGDFLYSRNTSSSSIPEQDGKAMYFQFDVSALPGGIAVSGVTFNFYVTTFLDDASAGALALAASADKDEIWDDTSNAGTLSALTLTSGGTANVNGTGWQEVDVSFSVTDPSTITVKITSPYGSETTATSGAVLGRTCLGEGCEESVDRHVCTLDVATNTPYLEIEYTPDLPGPCSDPLGGVTGPVAQDNWCIGDTESVTWSNGASTGHDIEIYLIGDSTGAQLLGTAAYPDTSKSITVPSVTPGFGYRVAVASVCDGGIRRKVWSDPFRIVDCGGEGEGEGEGEPACEDGIAIIVLPEYVASVCAANGDQGGVFFKFPWPAHVKWADVTSCEIMSNPYQSSTLGFADFTVNAVYCAADQAWGEGNATPSTLNGLSMGSTLGTALADNTGELSGGYYRMSLSTDVSGASISGVPQSITIKLEDNTDDDTASDSACTLGVGDLDWFTGDIEATETYIVIRYSCPGDDANNAGAAAFF